MTAQPAARPRTLAFYLPQFHPIPENDATWGAGFTEWTNVVRARPAFPGHHQPHLPADLGFYDLRLPEAREAQAALARRFGVDGFCYYHYWFHGRRLLNRPLDDVLASGKPDFPFLLCWANEDWRARWDGRSGEVLQAQRYSREDDEAHIAFLLGVFRDPRYVRVDGKPVFLVYRAAGLPDPLATTALWRARAREAGVGELLLCRVESGFGVEHGDPRTLGFDAAVEFQPDWDGLGEPDPQHRPRLVFDYGRAAQAAMAKPAPDYPLFRGVMPRWDNTPRRQDDGAILLGATPDGYRHWLEHAVRNTAPGGLVFVNAWNEWAEGAHLEPDQEFGLAFLDAHAAAVCPPTSREAEAAREAILTHRRALRELETAAERRLASGDAAAALRLARAAADWAWYNHTGLFVSRRLERIVQAAGCLLLADLPQYAPAHASQQCEQGDRQPETGERQPETGERQPETGERQPEQGDRRRVLHVLTEAHAVGGHTRLAWRWMARDTSSEHSVVLTGQGSIPVPDELVAAAGGRMHRLAASMLSGQVLELAELMQRFDLVVLHVHPFDAVAVAACADPARRPPTLLLNHADHVFWLGVGGADAIANVRPSGAALTMARRGVAADRCVPLPSPLDPEAREFDRAEAKRRLGLPPDAVVLLTMAAPYKYAPAGGARFTDLAARLLAEHPQAHLIAVGPTLDAPGWAALADAAPGRVQALGYRTDTRTLLEAADVYLDSFPFTSPTSLLEAALLDTPVLALAEEPAAGPLAADDFGAQPLLATSAEEWLALGGQLIGAVAARAEHGEWLGAGVRSVHHSPGWNGLLARAYAGVRHGAAALPAPVAEVLTPLDDLLYLLHERGGMARRLPDLLATHGIQTAAAGAGPEPATDAGTDPALVTQQARSAAASEQGISVVVLARDGIGQTAACLNAVVDACAPCGGLDIVVVDHATTDGTGEALADLSETVFTVRVDDPSAAARALWTAGVAHALGDRVLLLTHDVLVDGPSVQRLLDALAAGAEPVGYLGSADAPGSTCLLYRRAHLVGAAWPSPLIIPIDVEEVA